MKGFSTVIREQLGLKNDPASKAEKQFAPGARLPLADRVIAGVDKYTTLDQLLPIKAIVRFRVYEEEVGAYILQRPDGTFQFVFGLDVGGYHSFLLEHQMEGLWNGVIAATRAMPEGEPLGIRLASFKSCDDRIEYLYGLIQGCKNPAIANLLMAEVQRTEALAAAGLREPKLLQIFASHTGRKKDDEETQADKTLKSVTGILDWMYGMYRGGNNKAKRQQEAKNTFLEAYTQGYQSWKDLLSQAVGVTVAPMSPAQMWEVLWKRINKSPVQPIPYLVTFTHDALGSRFEEEGDRSFHLTRHLQHDCTPRLDHQFVRLDHYDEHAQTIINNYVGVLSFTDKVEAWSSGYQQLRYLWNLISHDSVSDTEIYCQLIAADKSQTAKQASTLYQQAMLDAQNASEKTRYQARAETQIKETKALMMGLSQGDAPCLIGACMLVHRPSLPELERACLDIRTKLRPNKIERERDVASRIWLQTTFCDTNPLMRIPGVGDLRFKYQAHEVPGMFPLIATKSPDNIGVEFIARDGGTPYCVDLFSQGKEKHLGIIAGHRSGKSETAISFCTHALSQAIPVTVMDYPTKDGTSSFYHYAQYVGGAYLDIGKESINILEIPDFRGFSKEDQEERFKDFSQFCQVQIMALLNPDPEDYQLKQGVSDVLDLALGVYFGDGLIQQRYTKAITEGFGTEAWQDTPTLVDFAEFCIRERLPLQNLSNKNLDLDRILSFIQRRFAAKLDPQKPIGHAIARPSTVRTDSLFTVFALRNMTDEDSAVYSLAAFSVAARRSLQYERSFVVFDEAQQLAGYEGICELAKTFLTTGGKQGVRVCMITNDFDALVQSKAGSSFAATLNIRLLGRLEHHDAEAVGKAFKIPDEIMTPTTDHRFYLDKQTLSSSWLLVEGAKYTYLRRYVPPRAMSLSASNIWERKVRQWYFERYGMQEGLRRFSEVHILSLKTGEPLSVPEEEVPIAV
jgi:hypothetical protein